MAVLRALLLMFALAVASAPGHAASASGAVRIGLTPVFLDEQITFLQAWRRYLEQRLDRPVLFVKKANYGEIVEMLRSDKLDFAWLCGFPYVVHRSEFRLLSVPLWQGRPVYQSYLIVPARDLQTKGVAELRNRVFAYSDPNSNSGYLVIQDALRGLGHDPATHFRKTFFTWSHRKVIEAVGSELASAGAVDGYVYDSLARRNPELTARTRIVERSAYFGFPPIVAHRRVAQREFVALQRVLLGMAQDPEGRRLLATLNLDGFVVGEHRLFDDILRMAQNHERATRVP